MPSRPADTPPDDPLAPLDVDGVAAVGIGTAVWAGLTLLTVLLRDRLESAGHGWWRGVCVAGLLLGLVGLAIVLTRRRRARSADR